MTKKVVLFAVGFTLGGMLYIIGADTSTPAAPACPHCAVLSPAIHSPGCDVAVQGGWICEGH